MIITAVSIMRILPIYLNLTGKIKYFEICQKHGVIIKYMETDKDHIHYMLETESVMFISKIVNLIEGEYIDFKDNAHNFTRTILWEY
mgnify:CR=1 FL=1